MYSARTVDKILAGKQMKRAIEAHTTTILALLNIYVIPSVRAKEKKEEMFTLIKEVKMASSELLPSRNGVVLNSSISKLKDKFKCLEFSAIFEGQKDGSQILKFVFNYVRQFENILLYIKSTREADINLHLSSLKDLFK